MRPLRLLLRRRCLLRSVGALALVVGTAPLLVLFLRFLLFQRELRGLRRVDAAGANVSLITFRLSHRWGMGNEMFALASTYGIMRSQRGRRRGDAWVVCVDRGATILRVFRLDDLLRCGADAVIRYLDGEEQRELAYGYFDSHLFSLNTRRHTVVGRFLQSWRYFHDFDQEIRQLFAFKESLATSASSTLRNAVENHLACSGCFDDVVKIGLHVRRGNMAESPELVELGYVVASSAYITRAMAFYDRKFATRRKIFVVCSDSISWCRENIRNRSDVLFMYTGKAELDMAILSMCDSSIITVGTFGWWAAWLANGTTVFYKDWPRAGSPLDDWTNHKDYFPHNWIGL